MRWKGGRVDAWRNFGINPLSSSCALSFGGIASDHAENQWNGCMS